MDNNIIINLITSIGSIAVVGFLFWSWLNTKVNSLNDSINDLKNKIQAIDLEMKDYLRKDDYFRRDGQLENQIKELKNKIDAMPEHIVSLLARMQTPR